MNRPPAAAAGRLARAGIGAFLALVLLAMGGLAGFARHAAEQNAAALRYEQVETQFQSLQRGLLEMALTDGALESLEIVRGAAREIRSSRDRDADLRAGTGRWAPLEAAIEDLTRGRRNVALADEDLIALGRLTAGLDRMVRELQNESSRRRADAVRAERHVVAAIVAASLLVLLGAGCAYGVILKDLAAREAREAASMADARLREITASLPAAIAYLDGQGRYLFQSRAYEEALGLDGARIGGRTMREVLGEALHAEVRPHADRALAGFTAHFERVERSADGRERHWAEHYFPRRGEGETRAGLAGFYAVVTDVTEPRRVERMKDEFISTVSHELRTPLTSIRGSLGLLAGGAGGAFAPAAEKLVNVALANCERLTLLVNDILDLEKIASGHMRFEPRIVELAAVVAECLAANEGHARSRAVALRMEAGPEAPRCEIDPQRLDQALANLVSNAIKYSPRGETVEVALQVRTGRARIEVRDRGPGIPEEFRARIFQRFSQADGSDSRRKGGTGLGLCIARTLVERMGGTIGYDTVPGAGTTFFIELPLAPPEGPAELPTFPEAQAA